MKFFANIKKYKHDEGIQLCGQRDLFNVLEFESGQDDLITDPPDSHKHNI